MNTLRLVLSLVLGIALPYTVQRWDKGRLPAEQRERAWNAASWGAALYAFGPFSMLGWVCVTRLRFAERWRESPARAVGWSLLLVTLGGLAAVALACVIGVVDVGVGWLVGEPPDVARP
jgi:hypothetical protein